MVALVLRLKNSLKIHHFGTQVRSEKHGEPSHHQTQLCCYLGQEIPQNIRDDAGK